MKDSASPVSGTEPHVVQRPTSQQERYTLEEWRAEATRRFGPNSDLWAFVCPSCGNIARTIDFLPFKDSGATPHSVTEVCIGRYTGAKGAFDPEKYKPCNYAGFGLFRLSPNRVIVTDENGEEIEVHCFAFAEPAHTPVVERNAPDSKQPGDAQQH